MTFDFLPSFSVRSFFSDVTGENLRSARAGCNRSADNKYVERHAS